MVSKIKKNSVKNKDNSYAKRLYTCGVIATGLFIIIIAHLAFIQFVEGKELSEKAYKQQVKNKIISPSRGTIYDANGEMLAQSIAVDTISLNPEKVVYANSKDVEDEVIAEGISSIFDITYEEMLDKLKQNK